jgi:hypothetical protein
VTATLLPRLEKTPGKGALAPFMRMRRAKYAPPSTPEIGFILRMPDGTTAKVVGGVVVDVWIAGEIPASTFALDLDMRRAVARE